VACLFPQHAAGKKHKRNIGLEDWRRSAQIRALVMDACDLVDVQYRAYPRYVRIYRRPSVELMQQHVGVKA
jgi:hypothetical protein